MECFLAFVLLVFIFKKSVTLTFCQYFIHATITDNKIGRFVP